MLKAALCLFDKETSARLDRAEIKFLAGWRNGRAEAGGHVAVVSYGQGRADNPSLQPDCSVMDKQTGILVMTCDKEFGSSGAPVFRITEGRAEVVSVI